MELQDCLGRLRDAEDRIRDLGLFADFYPDLLHQKEHIMALS